MTRGRITVVAGLTAAFLVGCSAPASESDAGKGTTSVVAATPTTVDSTPADAGAPELAARLEPVVSSAVTLAGIPAVVVRVETPTGTWEKAYGTRTYGGGDAVTVADHFRVGSVTKTMVATVVLQLVEQGKLGLADTVDEFVPDFPGGSQITVEQLLDMRSGLFSYSEDQAFNTELDDNPARVWSPTELVDIAAEHPPYFEPDSAYRYTNTNTVLAALIAEQVSGEPIRDLLRERIFEPLELRDTSFPAVGDRLIPAPSPRGYLYGTNVDALRSARLPDAQLQAARSGELAPNDVTELDPSWIWAAGGAISTAADLATYAKALVDGDLLAPEIDNLRLASVAERDADNPATVEYGLGWMAFGPMIGHDGAIPGFQTFVGRDPATDITIIVLCTMRDTPAGVRPANEIAKQVFGVLHETR